MKRRLRIGAVLVVLTASASLGAKDCSQCHKLHLTGEDFAAWRSDTGQWDIVGDAALAPGAAERCSTVRPGGRSISSASRNSATSAPTSSSWLPRIPTPACTSWAATRCRCSIAGRRNPLIRASSAAASISVGTRAKHPRDSRDIRRGSTPRERRGSGRRSTSSSGPRASMNPGVRLPTPASRRSSTTASSSTETSS